jgi:hypothetical protein
VSNLGSIGAQQLRVPREVVGPMTSSPSLAFDAQSASHARQQTGVLTKARRLDLVRPKGEQAR